MSFACLHYNHIISYELCKSQKSNKQEPEQSIAKARSKKQIDKI